MSGFGAIYLCWWCKYFDAKGFDTELKVRCKAFPERIPKDIFLMNVSHVIKYSNDHDIQFERQLVEDQLPEILKIALEEEGLHQETLFQITMMWLEEKRYPNLGEIVEMNDRNRENITSKSESKSEQGD